MTLELFQSLEHCKLGEDAWLFPRFLTAEADELFKLVMQVAKGSPFRRMVTPNGYQMSVAMTNCGDDGWVTDKMGYRYTAIDPLTQQAWPKMPVLFYQLACDAAKQAGFTDFSPNACLINHYKVGSKLSLHQDKDESNLRAPIVSFSLGLPATFLWGGLKRSDKVYKVALHHADAVVWGGVDRLRFHGVAALLDGVPPSLGKRRINLTFRQTN